MENMTVLGLYFFVTGMFLIVSLSRLIMKVYIINRDKSRGELTKTFRKDNYLKQFIQYTILYHIVWFYVWAVNLLTRTVDQF